MSARIERLIALKALYGAAWRRAVLADNWDEAERVQARTRVASVVIANLVDPR